MKQGKYPQVLLYDFETGYPDIRFSKSRMLDIRPDNKFLKNLIRILWLLVTGYLGAINTIAVFGSNDVIYEASDRPIKKMVNSPFNNLA